MIATRQTPGTKIVMAEEPQQLVLMDDPMNLDNQGLLGAQIDRCRATLSSPNEPDYAYTFTFLKKVDRLQR